MPADGAAPVGRRIHRSSLGNAAAADGSFPAAAALLRSVPVRVSPPGRMLWLVALALAVVGKPSDVAGAIAFVQTVGTAGSQTVGTTVTVTVGAAGVAADDTLIVAVALDPASGAVACADDGGNVYTV